MNDPSARDSRPRRRVVLRTVTLEPRGEGEHLAPIAVCPRKLSLLSVEQCALCSDFAGLCVNPDSGPPFMRCAFDEAPFVHAEPGSVEASSIPSTCVADVMSVPVQCLSLDMTLDQVLNDVLARAEHAPVTDRAGRAVGLITKADVVQRLYDGVRAEPFLNPTGAQATQGRAQPEAITVGEMMLSATFMVSSDVPVGQVAAMMAYERVHHVLVVDAQQKLLGVVSSLDIARWVACRSGYVVPAGDPS